MRVLITFRKVPFDKFENFCEVFLLLLLLLTLEWALGFVNFLNDGSLSVLVLVPVADFLYSFDLSEFIVVDVDIVGYSQERLSDVQYRILLPLPFLYPFHLIIHYVRVQLVNLTVQQYYHDYS